MKETAMSTAIPFAPVPEIPPPYGWYRFARPGSADAVCLKVMEYGGATVALSEESTSRVTWASNPIFSEDLWHEWTYNPQMMAPPESNPVTAANPVMIAWARERSHLCLTYVARAMDKTTLVIQAWEDGASSPTYDELETFGKVCGTPLAMFFLPAPPEPLGREGLISALLGEIAHRALNFETLETRKSDRLDFKEVAVWDALTALRMAAFATVAIDAATDTTDIKVMVRYLKEWEASRLQLMAANVVRRLG